MGTDSNLRFRDQRRSAGVSWPVHLGDSGGRRRGGPAPLVPRAEREYIDFHNLLKINGVWKITNKTATHSSRTAPLKPRFEAD
jgi:hypothetical protein